jgi:hypothetical protein
VPKSGFAGVVEFMRKLSPMLIGLVLTTAGCGDGGAAQNGDGSEKVASIASASSWRPVTISQDKFNALLVDDSTIQRDGNNARAWVASFLMKEGRKDGYFFREFNCKNGEFRTLQVTEFPNNGLPITDATATDWRFAIPGSMNEHVLNYVCFGQLP